MRRFMFVAAFVLAAVFVQAASAAPPGATHVYGSGSTVWGDGTQSFNLNVFSKADGSLGGHMSWHGVTSTPYNQPLDYSGHPDCLAVSGNIAVTSVVHYYPGQVFPYQGAIEIAVDNGSVDQAWGELLEAGDKASAQGVCRDTLDTLSSFGPLPTLNGEVTVT